jgi:membrane protein DedA with SNARE-associated domain/rhodanese-related sulfurtransferase
MTAAPRIAAAFAPCSSGESPSDPGMSYLVILIKQYGLPVVFINVLVGQLGAPIPAYPTFVVTGALLERGESSIPALLSTAVCGAFIADFAWYMAGRRYGRRILAMLCRVSLSPDSCVRQTETIYSRWGASCLLIAKFIPGFSAIASTLAGALGTRRTSFILFDTFGAALWAGSGIYLGSLFSTTVDEVPSVLGSLGNWGVLLIGAALFSYAANKWWQRRRFLNSLQTARISVHELHQLQMSGTVPIILDVRPALSQVDSRIPGAVMVMIDDIDIFTLDADFCDEIVIYCACPDEASAARAAKMLLQKGYRHVCPLAGGIDAWVAAGHAVES